MNIADTIAPKSDQINADDLIGGSLLVRIVRVTMSAGADQPVDVHVVDAHSGAALRPWRPCKSMRRVLVAVWGSDASAYTGRTVELYRDPSVRWAGAEVGGIRIRAMSDIPAGFSIPLTTTRGKRDPYRVERIASPPRPTSTAAPTDPLPGFRAKVAELGLDADAVCAWVAEQLGAPIGEATRNQLGAAYKDLAATDGEARKAFAAWQAGWAAVGGIETGDV